MKNKYKKRMRMKMIRFQRKYVNRVMRRKVKNYQNQEKKRKNDYKI